MQLGQVLEARVGDSGVDQVKVGEVLQLGQLLEARVGNYVGSQVKFGEVLASNSLRPSSVIWVSDKLSDVT